MKQDSSSIFVVTGITGQVGGVVARTLLQAGKTVRGVVRSADKGAAWAKQGCEVAIADMSDAAALATAFTGAGAVFVLLPPIFAPGPGFPETRAAVAALKLALNNARPSKIVAISTVGAQAKQVNLLTQLQIMEQSLRELPIPTTMLRAAWFMENAAWDVEPAAKEGVLHSFLQPLDRKIPMVATADVGRVAAELLGEQWTGHRIVELEGPARVAPVDIAAGFSRLLGRPVRAQAVPRENWKSVFAAQGGGNVEPRIQMLDGINDGWICFESDSGTRKGSVVLDTVLGELVARFKHPR